MPRERGPLQARVRDFLRAKTLSCVLTVHLNSTLPLALDLVISVAFVRRRAVPVWRKEVHRRGREQGQRSDLRLEVAVRRMVHKLHNRELDIVLRGQEVGWNSVSRQYPKQ